MKTTNIALIGVIVAGLAGAGLVSASLTTPLFLASTQTSYVENSPIMGHITAIAFDVNGDIKSYLQSDNLIVNRGENCIAEVLFDVATTNSTMACAGTGSSTGSHGPNANGFTFIGIGTVSTAPTVDDTALGGEVETREDAGVAGVSVADAENQATGAVVTIVDTFTMTASRSIEEYGLFDQLAAGGNMFARQTPGLTSLSTSDTLQVTWTINVGS